MKLTNEQIKLIEDCLDFIPIEFIFYTADVGKMGIEKYGYLNWLKVDGIKASFTQMHDSAFHHIAQSFSGLTLDKESGLHPLAHAAWRCLAALHKQKLSHYGSDK